MIKINLCQGKKFEWHNGELFAVSDSVCKDTAWLDSYNIELIHENKPDGVKEGEFPFFVIQRLPTRDLVFEVEDYVVFNGGDVLCFIKPIAGLH